MPTRQNIRIYQGADFLETFSVPGIAPSAQVSAEFRQWPSGPLLARFAVGINIGMGTASISLHDQQTRRLKRSGVYDLLVTEGANTIAHYFGLCTLMPGVSVEPSSPPLVDLSWLDMSQNWDDLSGDFTWDDLPDALVPSNDEWPFFNMTWDALSPDITWEMI